MQKLIFSLSLILSVTCTLGDDLDQRISDAYLETFNLNQKATAAVKDNDQRLSVLNVNLGLLTGKIAYVPEYEVRKKHFAETLRKFIFGAHVDVVFIQEVWFQDDFEALNSMARKEGFLTVFSDNEWSARVKKYGMQILVRKATLKEGSGISQVALDNFSKTTSLEYYGGYKRGLMSAAVTLSNERNIRLANAHLSATAAANDIRRTQVKETAKLLKEKTADDEMILFGADFNVSPEFEMALPAEVEQWGENRAPYVDFYESLYLIDAFKAVHPYEKGYTWDKRTNSLISSGPAVIKDEPLQRTDFIWAGIWSDTLKDVTPMVRVEEAMLVFTEPTIEANGRKVHLTDHFGVFAKLRLK